MPYDDITPLKEVLPEKTATPKAASTLFITNPDKILYPEDGFSKNNLLNYYDAVSDFIFPYLSLGPLTLVRCPAHYNTLSTSFNKTTAKSLHPIEDPKDEAHEHYIYLNDQKGLFGLVRMSVLEIHPWGTTIKHVENPMSLLSIWV